MTSLVITGKCELILPTLMEASVDSIVCDPPYHLTGATRFGKTRSERGFMDKTWDGGDVAFRPDTWEAAARVVRPGGYLLAFGGTRTWHRLACAIEDGGWEIVDTLAWMYAADALALSTRHARRRRRARSVHGIRLDGHRGCPRAHGFRRHGHDARIRCDRAAPNHPLAAG